DPVQRRVESGDGEGAFGEVGGDHVLGVAGGVQGLDPAAAAQVQHAADGGARGDPGQGEGGAAHAEDVLRAQRTAGRQLREVRGDPPVDLPGVVARRVRGEVEQGAHRAVAVLGGGGAGAAVVGAGGSGI